MFFRIQRTTSSMGKSNLTQLTFHVVLNLKKNDCVSICISNARIFIPFAQFRFHSTHDLSCFPHAFFRRDNDLPGPLSDFLLQVRMRFVCDRLYKNELRDPSDSGQRRPAKKKASTENTEFRLDCINALYARRSADGWMFRLSTGRRRVDAQVVNAISPAP